MLRSRMQSAHLALLGVLLLAGATYYGATTMTLANSAPLVVEIQRAYDVEASKARAEHQADLTIVAAECAPDQLGSYLCWIRYRAASKPADALQFDIVSLERQRTGWKLTSGLCVTPPA
jgi:hypothetical protein